MKIFFIALVVVQLCNGIQSSLETNSLKPFKEYIQETKSYLISNCSSDFILSVESNFYDETSPLKVTFESRFGNGSFSQIFLFAEDKNSRAVGRWETDDVQSSVGPYSALTPHSDDGPARIEARWFSTNDTFDEVFFSAIVIEQEKLIFFDCYQSRVEKRTRLTNKLVSDLSDNNGSVISPTVDVGMNVTWSFDPKNKINVVRMTITNLKSAEWAAIGLGTERAMGKAHVFMCKRLADDSIIVNRYINPSGHQEPELAGDDAGGHFTPTEQTFRDGLVICEFTLSNFNQNSSGGIGSVSPLSQTTSYFPLFAVGLLDADEPLKHAKDSRKVQTDQVQLDRKETILYKLSSGNSVDQKKWIRVHGMLMIFTWIFVVSNGILISRYFRRIEFEGHIGSLISWFEIHRILMSLASVTTLLGFFFIFTALQGNWVETNWNCAFVHSILGIVVIGLTFSQPFIGLFRCSTTSSYRFIFNYVHRTIGFVTLILSMIVLCLATYLRQVSNELARMSMIVWIIWIILMFILFESIDFYFRRRVSYTPLENLTEVQTVRVDEQSSRKATSKEKLLKIVLLLLHICVAAFLSGFLSFLIYRS